MKAKSADGFRTEVRNRRAAVVLTLPPEAYPGLKWSLALRKDQTMKRKRFTEEQIIAILKEHEAGVATADLCRKHGVSERDLLQVEGQIWRPGRVGGQAAEGA